MIDIPTQRLDNIIKACESDIDIYSQQLSQCTHCNEMKRQIATLRGVVMLAEGKKLGPEDNTNSQLQEDLEVAKAFCSAVKEHDSLSSGNGEDNVGSSEGSKDRAERTESHPSGDNSQPL
jgi:hypothetical protein